MLAPIAVDAVLKVIDPKTATNVDLTDVRIVKKLGGTIEDTELVDGLVLSQKVSTSAGGPRRMKDAKIGLIQFCLSAPKTDMENNIQVRDYQAMDRLLREERTILAKMVKQIAKTGCNVLLLQKSILRDSLSDLGEHLLAKNNILLGKDIERNDIELISKSLGCSPVAHIHHLSRERLANAKLVEIIKFEEGEALKITGIELQSRTATVLLRGSNNLILEETERCLHDALCVVRCLVLKNYFVPGGAACEIEIVNYLCDMSKKITRCR